MHRGERPARSLFPASRVLLTALLAIVAVGSAGPARAGASAIRAPGVATYTVRVSPSGEVTLCPDQTQVFTVSLRRQVARAAGNARAVGRPRTLPRARISASVSPGGVGTIVPGSTQTARWRRPEGSTSSSSVQYTFTAGRTGDATITFRGVGLWNPPPIIRGGGEELTGFSTNPIAQVVVHVKCNFLLNMDSYWQIPGERSHEGRGRVRNVGIAPDAVGAFSVQTQMRNTVVVSGGCTGGATVGSSPVTVEGTLDPNNRLYIKVIYGPVPHTSWEGCVGKSRTGAGTPRPLEFQFVIDQRRVYDLTLSPHVMDDDAGALPGTTLVDLYRLTP